MYKYFPLQMFSNAALGSLPEHEPERWPSAAASTQGGNKKSLAQWRGFRVWIPISNQAVFRRLPNPAKPTSAEPNSQKAAGTGTAEISASTIASSLTQDMVR